MLPTADAEQAAAGPAATTTTNGASPQSSSRAPAVAILACLALSGIFSVIGLDNPLAQILYEVSGVTGVAVRDLTGSITSPPPPPSPGGSGLRSTWEAEFDRLTKEHLAKDEPQPTAAAEAEEGGASYGADAVAEEAEEARGESEGDTAGDNDEKAEAYGDEATEEEDSASPSPAPPPPDESTGWFFSADHDETIRQESEHYRVEAEPIDDLSGLEAGWCPGVPPVLEQAAGDAPGPWSGSAQISKYAERAAKGQCNAGDGVWGGDYSDSYWCLMEWAGREHYAVGDRVLDWGSGCGHKASWMRIHFGVDVYGLDLEAGAVEWANNHSLGHFCATDGSKLEFLADQSFNHVFSVAAIYHLPYEVQCDVLQQFLRVIVDGGTISIMWNGNHLRDRPSKWPAMPWWRSCVAGSPWPSSTVSIAEEKTEVVGNFQIGPMDEDAFGRRV